MRKDRVEDILVRLAKVLAVNTDTELAKALGTTSSTVSSWKARESVPYAKCVEIARQFNISLDWLLTGDGTMLKGGVAEPMLEQPLTPRQQAVLGLFNALSDEKQREILSALEDKKRMIDMEAEFKELKSVLAALKSAG